MRQQLIRHYLPHARMLAATIFARRMQDDIEFDEYFQLASLGLVEAVDRFDPRQGAQFETFCAKRIRGAVLSGLPPLTEKGQQVAARLRLRKERLASLAEGDGTNGGMPASDSPEARLRYLAEVGIGLALGVLLEGTGMLDADAFGSEATAPSPEVAYFQRTQIRQLGRIIGESVGQLPASQQTVIRAHYLHERAFGDIAAMMGLTRARISQLHRQGLLRLRDLLPSGLRCDVSL